jgi:16S rRNA processing protein RimM
MSRDDDQQKVCLGAIAGAHGVRGEVRIKPFTEDPLDVAAYGPVSSEDGTRRFVISAPRLQKAFVVARLEGINDRGAAEALKGTRFYVPRALLPPPDEDETWYHADLIGLAVEYPQGTPFGTVVSIQDFGAGDLVEIRPHETTTTVLVPFTRDAVPVVDMASRLMLIDPPEGLLNDDEDADANTAE